MRGECPVSADLPAFAPHAEPKVPLAGRSRAAEILADADRPIILAGGGCSGRERRPRSAIWPIASMARHDHSQCKGLIDERTALARPRSSRRQMALDHADAMLAVGCRFTEVFSDGGRMVIPNVIDPDRPRSGPDRCESPGRRRDCRRRSGRSSCSYRGDAVAS